WDHSHQLPLYSFLHSSACPLRLGLRGRPLFDHALATLGDASGHHRVVKRAFFAGCLAKVKGPQDWSLRRHCVQTKSTSDRLAIRVPSLGPKLTHNPSLCLEKINPAT